jgi:4-hydroxythreonine-4-phosphate dehydrogenase
VVTPVRIAVTLGDPRGIGPEVMTRAARLLRERDPSAHFLLLGSAADVAAGGDFDAESLGSFDGSIESAGEISVQSIRRAVDLASQGNVAAIVTGPVHKPALHAAGAIVPGQTEFLGALTGSPRVGMLMHAEATTVGRPLRILLATTHIALRDVPGTLTSELIESQVELLHESLVNLWGIATPEITLCALNPHASDGGLFGDEEERVLGPASRRLRQSGIQVSDPLAADTAFLTMVKGNADAVVVPYHDVGMAVFKTLAFGRGVNVTIGLPFPRTSPDHGTAFDLAGRGLADPTSALESMLLAVRLARRSVRSPF